MKHKSMGSDSFDSGVCKIAPLQGGVLVGKEDALFVKVIPCLGDGVGVLQFFLSGFILLLYLVSQLLLNYAGKDVGHFFCLGRESFIKRQVDCAFGCLVLISWSISLCA